MENNKVITLGFALFILMIFGACGNAQNKNNGSDEKKLTTESSQSAVQNKPNARDYLKKDAIIIDVRTPQEYASGHIEGAVNIPVNNIETKINELKEMGKPIITYCAAGVRSARAARALKANGFDVYDGGGMKDLQKELN